MYNAALPAMAISRPGGGEAALGWVNACTGVATLLGGVFTSLRGAPRSRVRVIHDSLLFAMSTETCCWRWGARRSSGAWARCWAGVCIPAMNANMDALLRLKIPLPMQARVYAARNTLQFCTIPVGYLLGGWLVDGVCTPLMAAQGPASPLARLLGTGGGAGRGAAVFDPRLRRRGRLPAFPPRPPHTRAGEVNDKPLPMAGRGACADGQLYFFISPAPAFHALPACRRSRSNHAGTGRR